MESSGRARLRHRMVLLAVLPLALAGFVSAPASASGQGSSLDTSVESPQQESSSGPGTAPVSEPVSEPASEPVTTEDPSTSGESGPGASETADDPEVEEPSSGMPVVHQPVAEQPAVEGSPATNGPRAAVPQSASGRARAPQPKVTICHRTNSNTNPYNQITVAIASANFQGHTTHTGPIFRPGLDDWGDIIPPVPGFEQGLNWPEGAPILNNGCEVPPPPDVGPQPSATIGDVVCAGTAASVQVIVTNGADATAPAFFAILVDGAVVDRVGPVAPGDSRTVAVPLNGLEDQTVTVAVRSGGDIIASQVVTVDCSAPPPEVDVSAELVCVGEVAQGTATVTNNGQQPIVVTATVDGTPVGTPLDVAPGATESATADLSQFEDQTITVAILVDGVVTATYVVTPDCVAPRADPTVSVAGQECPPPSTTVTLGNAGDPDSQVVFVILVDGKVVQKTAPVFGGDTTTIVGDLSRFEDQTVVVELRANGEVLASRTIHVNCVTVAGASAGSARPGSETGSGVLPAGSGASGVLPGVGAGFGLTEVALGLGLVLAGALLILAGSRRSGSRQA